MRNRIDKALRQAVTLTAAAWPPSGYTGPLKPGDLITYAIKRALTDKDKLTGVEVHEILDNLNIPHLKPAVEAAG